MDKTWVSLAGRTSRAGHLFSTQLWPSFKKCSTSDSAVNFPWKPTKPFDLDKRSKDAQRMEMTNHIIHPCIIPVLKQTQLDHVHRLNQRS
jgi:hypothetical protein